MIKYNVGGFSEIFKIIRSFYSAIVFPSQARFLKNQEAGNRSMLLVSRAGL
jgi:hypothetical protein